LRANWTGCWGSQGSQTTENYLNEDGFYRLSVGGTLPGEQCAAPHSGSGCTPAPRGGRAAPAPSPGRGGEVGPGIQGGGAREVWWEGRIHYCNLLILKLHSILIFVKSDEPVLRE